ncbi:MAG: UDP-glucose 4-epimerase GalE [Deltaproteobacteria bacterium]|nr:UDP-glucose 4-epimerase GalE [Deltaproteobacteria bacterium]
MKILVTGGAGYIGGHVILRLKKENVFTVVYDNFSTGVKDAVLYGEIVTGDLKDKAALSELFLKYKFDAVFHLAASVSVTESLENPLKYYNQNLVNTINLLSECVKHNTRYFIFSSTAAVYSDKTDKPVSEKSILAPQSPYGYSKMAAEKIIEDFSKAYGINFVILRYFNVAGADYKMRIGQSIDSSHLIKKACQTALASYKKMSVYGTDYKTFDGTAIRDYIHVEDIAQAHMLALQYLKLQKKSGIFNVGYGRGYSVKQIVEAVKKVSKVDFTVENRKRRKGDAESLIADNRLIKNLLGWRPKYDNIDDIVETAWKWEQILYKKNNALA